MRRTTLGGVAVLAALALLPPGSATAAATITTVAYPIDSSNQAAWWSPLETYGPYYGRN
jgi:hypothetical protein